MGRDAGQIAEAIVQHLPGLVGSDLDATLEISASVPKGVPGDVVQTATENANTLRFRTRGFECE